MFPNLQIAIQMDNNSNGYSQVSNDICLSKNREQIFCVLHLEEYCSKFPWIISSHVLLKGEQFQGELTMIWRQELSQVELSQGKLFQTEMPQEELLHIELTQAELPQTVMYQGELTMTLTAKLSIEKLALFPSMLPDDLLGQAILLSLNDGIHVRAKLNPTPIQHNPDVKGCSERSYFPTIGYNYYRSFQAGNLGRGDRGKILLAQGHYC